MARSRHEGCPCDRDMDLCDEKCSLGVHHSDSTLDLCQKTCAKEFLSCDDLCKELGLDGWNNYWCILFYDRIIGIFVTILVNKTIRVDN